MVYAEEVTEEAELRRTLKALPVTKRLAERLDLCHTIGVITFLRYKPQDGSELPRGLDEYCLADVFFGMPLFDHVGCCGSCVAMCLCGAHP